MQITWGDGGCPIYLNMVAGSTEVSKGAWKISTGVMHLKREFRRASATDYCGDTFSYHQCVYAKHIPRVQERYRPWHAFSV